ncbi:MAG: HlyD family secretion protein [Gemmataceae bacterium]
MRWKLFFLSLLGLLVLGGGVSYWWSVRQSDQSLHLPGVVEIQEVRLGSKIGGRVLEVRTAEGKVEEAGKVLVIFDGPELRNQREQLAALLASAQADYDKAVNGPRPEEKEAALAAYKAAEARWRRVENGPRQEEIDQARSEFRAAESDFQFAQSEYDRIAQLYQAKTVSRSDYDSARATFDRTRSRVALNKAKLDLLLAGSRQEDKDEAKSELARLKANYELLQAGTREEDKQAAKAKRDEIKAKLEEVETNLGETVLKAPARAFIEVLAVRKGDLVPPNTPVIRILYADDLWVKVYIPETDLGKIHVDQAVKVSVDSYPGEELDGTIIQISNASEFTPRNIQSADERKHQVFGVKVQVKDPRGIFKSGMAAEVRIPLQAAHP